MESQEDSFDDKEQLPLKEVPDAKKLKRKTSIFKYYSFKSIGKNLLFYLMKKSIFFIYLI